MAESFGTRRDVIKSAAMAGIALATGGLLRGVPKAVKPLVDQYLNKVIKMRVHVDPD